MAEVARLNEDKSDKERAGPLLAKGNLSEKSSSLARAELSTGSMKDHFRAVAIDALLKRIDIGHVDSGVSLDVSNPLDVVHYFVTLPARLDAYDKKL